MVQALVAHVEGARTVAEERAAKPRRQGALEELKRRVAQLVGDGEALK